MYCWIAILNFLFSFFYLDALAFQRNINTVYCMKLLKPFPVEDRLYVDLRCYIRRQNNFSFIHTQLIFLGEILTQNELNGNAVIDFLRAGI